MAVDFFTNMVYRDFAYPFPKQFNSKSERLFKLSLPIQQSWATMDRRFLIVYETVDSEDIKAHKLLSSYQRNALQALIKLGRHYSSYHKPISLAAINFDYFRNRHLPAAYIAQAYQANSQRISKYIKLIEPTDVFILGESAACCLLSLDARTCYFRQGRPMLFDGIWYTWTEDIALAYQARISADDESRQDKANLLGFQSRCFGNAMLRKPVHEICLAKPVGRWITKIGEWKKLHAKMSTVKAFSLDTETQSLARKTNKILILQIAFGPTIGYCVPIYHADTPFSPTELEVIRSDMRKLMARDIDPLDNDPNRFILGQNLKFDMTVLREWLQIQTIQWPLLDLMSAEFCLDENMKAHVSSIDGKRYGSFGMEFMMEWYGSSFYHDNSFGKKHRASISKVPLATPGLLEYVAADVVYPWEIWHCQQERAKVHTLYGKSYLPYYRKLLLTQMSAIVHMQSQMEHRGDHLDIDWLKKLRAPDGPLSKAQAELASVFKEFKSVKKATSILLQSQGVSSISIFGTPISMFDIGKHLHKKVLFFDILGLTPIAVSIKTGEPSFDKEFQEHYKDVPEVAAFKQLSQVAKVRSTYVEGFLKRIAKDADMQVDHCLRPNFGHVNTVTGRPNSSNPNLQNIIQRGPLAKLVKRAFSAPPGCLTMKIDFSAHEIRIWGIRAGDRKLTGLFVRGRWLRSMFRKTGKEVYKKLAITIGDIHCINCVTFSMSKTEADVTKDQRDQVKSIVFGQIYGRSAKAIALQINANVDSIKSLIAKFIARFPRGFSALKKDNQDAVTYGHTASPIGRMRNLYAHYFEHEGLTAGVARRGANAPIQGFAADIGQVAAYLYEIHLYKFLRKFNLEPEGYTRAGVSSFVHDSIKTVTPYEYVIPALYILQWCCTVGVCEYYSKVFGIKWAVEPEIEIEMGCTDDTLGKWDWHDNSLHTIVRESLEKQALLYDINIDAVEATIWNFDITIKAYLEKHYPIFGNWPEADHIDPTSPEFRQHIAPLLEGAQ